MKAAHGSRSRAYDLAYADPQGRELCEAAKGVDIAKALAAQRGHTA